MTEDMGAPVRRAFAWLAGCAVALALPAPATAGASAAGSVRISTPSTRADLVSGGQALVVVAAPAGIPMSRVHVRLGRRDVTRQFAVRPDGRFAALLTGLHDGRNVVTATVRGGRGARLTITNHPNGGPLFSGPQIHPWICQKSARDTQCNEPPSFSYLYKSTDPTKPGMRSYDPVHPPSDVATTTTDAGVRVPFVVREETGYQDRDRYRIETLYRPGEAWDRWAPQRQWNHKVLVMHGGSCHTSYGPTSPPFSDYSGTLPAIPGVEDSSTVALGRGFLVMSTALDNAGADCNVALQAESILMAKEHVAESYGDIRWTIGTGCSGGSLAEQWMANAYPGLYDGLIAQCTFPDADSTAQQIFDYALLADYLGVPIDGPNQPVPAILGEALPKKGWTTVQAAAVAGDGLENLPVSANWAFSAYNYFGLADPRGCPGFLGNQAYDPARNPAGVRCGVLDWQINLLGPRDRSVWGPEELKAGRGFAGIPVDNVGVQYGLDALKQGIISAQQFVDLNAGIGGGDPDLRQRPQRLVADEPALGNAYRTGLINEGDNLDRVPIINLAGPNDPGLAHDSYRAFALRARLDRAHGTHANQVMWQGPVPIAGDVQYTAQALVAIDRWLAAIHADTSARPLAAKVIADRPSDVHEQCSDGIGNKLLDALCGNAVVPVYGTPRTVAGEPIATDQNKCRLRPLSPGDYGGVTFTDAQWASLQKTFASGVCDYAQPGVDQGPVVPWLTYADAHGHVVYGGRPLGAPPRSHPCRARCR